LLLANGRVIQLAGRRVSNAIATGGTGAAVTTGAEDVRTLRTAALRSIFLWCTLVVLGLLLTTVRPS
jgi:hypothetical protein